MKIDVPKLLEALGIKAERRGRVWRALCPSHTDKDPSWSIVDDVRSERHGSHHCFACGFNGGPWELVARARDITLEEAGRWVRAEMLGIRAIDDEDVPIVVIKSSAPREVEMRLPNGVQIPSLDGSEWHPTALAYLESRGVPAWQRERWHLGFATSGRLAWRIVVPVMTKGRLLSYVARAWIDDGRSRYDVARRGDPGARPDVAIFGEPGVDLSLRVATYTEGVFKTLAMERAGAPNPQAILGASNLGPEKIALMSRFDVVLLAMDPDRAGRECADKIERAIGRWCDVRRVPLTIAPDDATEEENAARIAEVWSG